MISNTKKDTAFEAALQLHQSGKIDAALAAYNRILRLRPNHAKALGNLGLIHRQRGQFELAQACYQKALKQDPRAGITWSNLANLYMVQGQYDLALAPAQRAVTEMPGLASAHDNLGFALLRLNRFHEAEQALLQALKLNPKAANAWHNLGTVYQRQSRLAEAAQAYQNSITLDPTFSSAFSSLLFCMHFGEQWSRDQIFAAHLQWAQQFETPVAALPAKHAGARSTSVSKPRVAFISSDLFGHPVSVFLKPLIENWPHDRFELSFYASVRNPDEMTQWFRNQATNWTDIYALSDEAAATQIAKDQVDVLIDLNGHTGIGGHTGANHLLVLAYRPAPVQISWLGYFDTTGMKSVDYVIADPVCVPQELEHLFVEKVLRLPDDFVCFEPPASAPDIAVLPALGNGYITFGSQNQLAKITDQVITLWAALLRRLPSARLLFQAKGFNDAAVVERYRQAFNSQGVAPERVDYVPGTNQQGILNNYQRIDIALDPFPCAGGTTTCEALWMGVPVVTLLGDRFGCRHSASHLSSVALQRLVAQDHESYLSISTALASDIPALATLRAGLRAQMHASPLCDGLRFANNFSALLESVS